MTLQDLYDKGPGMSREELIEIAKTQMAVMLREHKEGEYRAKCYIHNIFVTMFIADDNPSFEKYQFYNSCGANHELKSYEDFAESCRLSKRIDFIDIIAKHLDEGSRAQTTAVIALAIIACVCDGRINFGEKAYLNKLADF